METEPQSTHRVSYERVARSIAAIAGSVIAFAAASPENSAADSQPYNGFSAALIEKHHIPLTGLPTIMYPGQDGFKGSRRFTPANTGPSSLPSGALERAVTKFMPLVLSDSGKWVGGLTIPVDGEGPMTCTWVVSSTLSDRQITVSDLYTDSTIPCRSILYTLKDRSVNDWINNCSTKRYKCFDGKKTNIVTSQKCPPSKAAAWGYYALDTYHYSNMSFPETRGGFYNKVHSLNDGDSIFWRRLSEDGKAVYGRTERGGWIVVDRDCLPDELPRGGPILDSEVVAGPRQD